MTHYKSNLRDIKFNLFELLGRSEILGHGPYEDMDVETAEAVLDEVDHLATTKLAESFESADRQPPVFDPESHTAPLPEAFKKSYDAWMESEFYQIGLAAEVGGQPAPPSLRWAMNELVLGANPAVYMYASGPKFGEMIFRNGTERDQKIGRIMADKLWGATMVLTEPDAGSDVGAGRTRALPQPDGSWHIEGVKRFITSAEHDLSDQIIHLVLARPVGVEGFGGPGTKGLSLFIVPKYDFDLETGDLGERNGVNVTNVEHKMGLKVSNTCELTFGDGKPAKGWLLGEVHNGIAQMFQVIEDARMMVGTKAIATLSTGYLNALDYAKSRIQGADLTKNYDKTAPRVTITHHPDVRRALLTQKAYVEGMRSLVLYTASIQDKVAIAAAKGEKDDDAIKLNDLLLPIVKGYGSEKSWTLLGTEALQTFGGSGFLADYPLEQYVRDAKIDTLYEGTTAIQGQDLFFRKIIRNQGKALGQLQAEIQQFLDTEGDQNSGGQLKDERELLAKALEDVEAIGTAMAMNAMSSDVRAGGDPRNLYKIGLNTTRLLFGLGDVVCAWLLLRSADIALQALGTDLPESEQRFYEGKVASARWFARIVLPKLAAERVIAEGTDLAAMELDEASF
ncbi:acyl-CoA dehydrogenase [Microlunatus endophyticus]|uniref:Broad-specificity linear acyl-CoA dehydrogenase FadE5 n=1 Tax=Microlunatus endophyticus TaxID=1716077 RepID=A0A917SB96_9ACTN|nr:acyl-CoA dehydrogenase [Microlunatus endophyticus]GGL65645.1 acyl-CoA dehydrogenase [Microlunatus endophyticus]